VFFSDKAVGKFAVRIPATSFWRDMFYAVTHGANSLTREHQTGVLYSQLSHLLFTGSMTLNRATLHRRMTDVDSRLNGLQLHA